MLYITLKIAASLTVLAWMPILVRFFRAWRARNNPISLAICVTIMFLMYICGLTFWMLNNSVSNDAVAAVIIGSDAIICVQFYLSLKWAKLRFHGEERSK